VVEVVEQLLLEQTQHLVLLELVVLEHLIILTTVVQRTLVVEVDLHLIITEPLELAELVVAELGLKIMPHLQTMELLTLVVEVVLLEVKLVVVEILLLVVLVDQVLLL
tara:strand:- start:147 stop:470 length:324 start_codon:yes stop_codon:yes gene_type:complete